MAAFAFLIGAAVGSFLNVVIDRLPAGRSLVHPRSVCDACQRPLKELDMVPIVSYLALRGRCRYCGHGIPLRVLLVEAAMASLATGLYIQHGLGIELFVLGAAVALLIVVAGIDYDHQLILNKMTTPAAVAALAMAAFWPDLGFPRTFFGDEGRLDSFLNSLISGASAFSALAAVVVLSRGGMGEGDVKLTLVLGLFLGFPAVVAALWLGAVSGGIVAIALRATGRKGRKDTIPFGVFLAGGAIAAIMMIGWITSRYQEKGLGGFTL